jgi:hypothetical protein
MKTLYFEGAGMNFYGEQPDHIDVGNFRIRTSFKNLDGKQIYLEMGNGHRHDLTKKKPKIITKWALHIDFVHEVTSDPKIDDCNKSRIAYDRKHTNDNYMYTKADITRWVNENLNCDFDTIEVLDVFYGYRVHGGNRTDNLMEDIELNHARAKARREAFEKVDAEYREALNEKYSKISRTDMDGESITIRCYASDQALGKTNLPREQRIEVTY